MKVSLCASTRRRWTRYQRRCYASLSAEKPVWSDVNFQRSFLDKVSKELGITKASDWYGITRKQLIKEKGARSLFNQYASLEEALRAIYPEHRWQSTKFTAAGRAPVGFWDNIEMQKEWLESIAPQLGVKQLSDWYLVSRKAIVNKGGGGLIEKYSSVRRALMAIYPDFPWTLSITRSKYLKQLEVTEKKMGIQNPEDWYSVRMTDLKEVGFPAGVSRMKLAELLAEKYPGYEWEKVYLLRGRYALQKRLERAVADLFKGEEQIINARKEANIVNPETSNYLEFDVFIPSLHLAFEFQERHHYTTSRYADKPLESYKQRDQTKIQLAQENGISLVVIPYWWDGSDESLAATIKQKRPDLLSQLSISASPIPAEMPSHFVDQQKEVIEDIGEATTACFLTKSHIDQTNWWLFEKYDGVRGFWNPKKKKFFSRNGTAFQMPQDIIEAMPDDIFLDGELWFGRATFQESMKICHRAQSSLIDWSSFKFMIFDVPNHTGTYEDRYNHLSEYLSRNYTNGEHKFMRLAPREVCRDMTHLEQFFQDIIDQGGEGIILRDPKAPYQPGRSAGYLKHKKFRDSEAKVVGTVGFQWECELPNGVRFTAGAATTEFAKKWNPQPGDIVTFKHLGFLFTTKKPKLPTIHRLRTDITWDDVVNNWKEPKPLFTGEGRRSMPKSKQRPKGYWRDMENRKLFLKKFAEEAGFDFFDTEKWKTIKESQIVEKQGGGLLRLFYGSLPKALEGTFPDVEWQEKRKPKGYWQDINNRRKVLTEFAEEMGFDPTVNENWRKVPFVEFVAKKGRGVLRPYGDSLMKAVAQTFPEHRTVVM